MMVLLFGCTLVTMGLLCLLFIQTGERSLVWYYHHFRLHMQAGLQELFFFIDTRQLWFAHVGFGMFLLLTLILFSAPWGVGLATLIVFLVLPYGLMRYARRRRLHRIEQQLPDFLQSLAAALQAGAGLQGAIQTLSHNTCAPLGLELALLLRQLRLGMPLTECVQELHQRTGIAGFLLLRACLQLGRSQGGGMADSLQQLALSLRHSLYLHERMRALAAQARLQAWVMCALPFVLAAALFMLDPDGWQNIWLSPLGAGIAVLIFVLLVSGMRMVGLIIRDL